jgi:two-component system sensor histidine kinase MprB
VKHLRLRSRLTLVAAAAVAVAVAVASAASFFVVRHQLRSEVDNQLRRQGIAATRTGARFVLPGLDPGRPRPFFDRLSSNVFQLVQSDGTVVQVSDIGRPLPVTEADLAVAAGHRTNALHDATVQGSKGHYRVLTVPVAPGLAVQVGRTLDDVDHSLGQLRLALLIVALAGVALAGALGWIVARAALHPVEQLTAATEHIANTQDLGATIDEGGKDELGRLARSFNAMLTALGASRREQAQLINDASHELRTPLTSLRTNIEVLLKNEHLPEADRRALLADVNGQLEEMTTLVGDLVELAREEEREPQPEDVDLGDIVDRALERARRRAPSVTFDADLSAVIVRGQPELLERAVLNVLDNAAKWSPPDGHVEIQLSQVSSNGAINGDSAAVLAVRDHGPGIAPDDLPRVFDRFYRAPGARALPGSGLGLAIVRQVVQEHAGTVSAATPPDGGTVVRISLPVVSGNGSGAGGNGPAAGSGHSGLVDYLSSD